MAMEIKLYENKNAVLQDGKPVYVTDDGQEFVADVPSMHANILKFKGDQQASRKTIKDLNEKYKPFTEIEDVHVWYDKATKAIATVKNLDDKTLVDAGKVEQVKAEVKEAYEGQVAQLKTTLQESETKHSEALTAKDRVIHNLTIGNEFANDPHFSGPNKSTNLFPDLARSYYGHHFKNVPVDGKPDMVRVVGYLNGNEILSRKPDTIGEPAEFNEAIGIIIAQDPRREEILASGHSGSGAGGGGGGTPPSMTDVEKLEKAHAEAMKNNNPRLALSIKNQLFKARQKLGASN